MAVAADRATLIIDSVFEAFRPLRDVLLVVGFYYSVKSISCLGYEAWKGLKTFVFARVFATRDLRTKYGEWAVVTVCTQGIGEQYAYELARKNMNVILVDKNLEKLNEIAIKIRDEHKMKAEVFQADFSQGEIVYRAIRSFLEKKEVGVLINNVEAESGVPTPFFETSRNFIWHHMNVNMARVAAMSHMVLPSMVNRGRGAIVNVVPFAGHFHFPLLSCFSATSAYMDCLSQSMEYEVRGTGVDILTLAPFRIRTNKIENPTWTVPDPQDYARSSIAVLGWERKTTGYWSHGLLAFLRGRIPKCLR